MRVYLTQKDNYTLNRATFLSRSQDKVTVKVNIIKSFLTWLPVFSDTCQDLTEPIKCRRPSPCHTHLESCQLIPLAGPKTCSQVWIQQSESQHLTAVRMNNTGRRRGGGGGGEDGHLLQPPLSLAINVMGEEDGGWILISSPVSTAPSLSNGAAHVPEMQKSLVWGTEYKLTLINLISTIPTKFSFFSSSCKQCCLFSI